VRKREKEIADMARQIAGKDKVLIPTSSLSTWSGTLRELLQSACAEECEKMTGARLIRRASSIVGTDTWDRSTIMPSRFISRTTSCNQSINQIRYRISLPQNANRTFTYSLLSLT